MSITPHQIKNFFIASMAADALGTPVEFEPRGSFHVTDMQGSGTYDQPAGTWSDDSSLTLALAETLNENGDPTRLMQKFVRYMEAGEYTPGGELFDIGNATRQAVIAFAVENRAATECGSRSPYANGNGALMRIAPLAFSLLTEPALERRAATITAYTTVTHGHERAIIASVLYVETLRNELCGLPLAEALATAWASVLTLNYDAEERAYFSRCLAPEFGTTAEEDIRSSGYVIDTLEAALWCNLQGGSLATVILRAVNLGEDTDTIAQIAACLYAAGHLDATVPATWHQTLVQTAQSQEIIETFAEKFGA